MLAPGIRLGPYEVLEPLGSGGMGDVYRARDHRLGRDLALKLLPEHAVADEKAVERFVGEARAASALNHPNVVTIYEIGETGAGKFIAMELISGRTLRSLIGEPHSLQMLSQWGAQIARGLAVAHAAGIVHRDVKPENIMLRDDGYVKVLDFGVARLLAQEDGQSKFGVVSATRAGVAVGTLRYMSPEQASAEPVDSATDVFSLGVVLYELATERHPFEASSEMGVVSAILTAEVPAPSRLNPGVSAQLDAVIERMLQKDARRRPTAAEVDAMLTELAIVRADSAQAAPTAPPDRRVVGREAERAELRVALDAASVGHGVLVAVAGEPGSGKTTLVEDFLSELAWSGPGHRITRGRCSERLAGTEAYLPLLEALDGLLRADSGGSVSRLMKSCAPTWYLQVGPLAVDESGETRTMVNARAASQERMKRELSAFFEELSRLHPVVVFIDDLHWADASTVDLLSYLGTRLGSMRMLIVATYRPSELMLARHPFVQVKLDLQSRALCHEVRLQFLTLEHVEQYLALEFPDHQFPPLIASLIHTRTEGSPLFMVDLLRDLRSRGVLVRDTGHWELAQSLVVLERGLPESIRSMIQRKIDLLDEDDRRLLMAASVQGYEFDSAVIVRLLKADAADVEERLEILEHVHAFVRRAREEELPDGTLSVRYRFVHVLYQNAFYASLTPTRRASWSAVVAQTLLDHHGDRASAIASDLAHLFEAGRDFTRAAESFLVAAQNAAGVFANQEAAVLARRGLEVLAKLPDTPGRTRQEMLLQITLGAALGATYGIAAPDVGRAFGRAYLLWTESGEAPELFAVVGALWGFYIVGAQMQMARTVAEKLLQLAEGAQVPTMLVTANWALGITLHHLGEHGGALEHLDRAIADYRVEQRPGYSALLMDPGVASHCESARVVWMQGYPDEAVRRLENSLSLADTLAHPESVGFAHALNAIVYQLLRDAPAVLEHSDAVLTLAKEREIATTLAWGRLLHGWALAEHGRAHDGLAEIRASLDAQRAAGSEIARTQFLAMLAEACIRAERFDEALAAIDEALVVAEATGDHYFDPELHRLRGEMLLEGAGTDDAKSNEFASAATQGVPAEPVERQAEACFRNAIAIAQRQEAKSLELRAAMSLSRLWQRQRKHDDARRLLSVVYGWFTEGFDTHDLLEAKALLDSM